MTTSVYQQGGFGTAALFPSPVTASRDPAATDTISPTGLPFQIFQGWINSATNASFLYLGAGTWVLIDLLAGDLVELTGDAGTALPVAGAVQIAGGTNITTSGALGVVTVNVDAAITLATSVTSPLYTAAAGVDVDIEAPTGKNIIIKMGDNAGANKVSFTDSDDVQQAAIDSNGGFTMGAITFTGLLTANASATILTAGTALTLAQDNSGDAVILGGGTVARAITIGQDAAAHTVTIGQAAAGAITIDTASGVSIDAAAASNFTVAGAGIDLTLDSGAGRVIINGEEAAANAITLLSAAGGIDADAALQINIDSSQAAADAIRLDASNAGGGIDIDTGTTGFIVDSTGAVSLDGAAASNFTVSGAGIDLTLDSGAGRVVVNGEEAAANAITLLSAAGGLDVDVALQMNLASSQNAADAIVIDASAGGIDITAAGAAAEDIDITCTAGSLNLTGGEAAVANAVVIDASAADGGIDCDSGTGGTTLDSTGSISIDAAAVSNLSVSGAGIDLNLESAAGRVVINGEEAAANAITLLSAAGGIDADCVLQMNLTSSQNAGDAIRINASAGGIDIDAAGAAGEDITIDNAAGSINLTAAEAAADAIVISASNAAGGITLDAGSGGVNLTGADLDVQGGDIQITGAAQQLQVEGGAATDFIGQAVLVNGQVTVANTNIAATDRVFATHTALNASTAIGQLLITITASTNFIIESKKLDLSSDETNDQSTIDFFIVRNL